MFRKLSRLPNSNTLNQKKSNLKITSESVVLFYSSWQKYPFNSGSCTQRVDLHVLHALRIPIESLLLSKLSGVRAWTVCICVWQLCTTPLTTPLEIQDLWHKYEYVLERAERNSHASQNGLWSAFGEGKDRWTSAGHRSFDLIWKWSFETFLPCHTLRIPYVNTIVMDLKHDLSI